MNYSWNARLVRRREVKTLKKKKVKKRADPSRPTVEQLTDLIADNAPYEAMRKKLNHIAKKLDVDPEDLDDQMAEQPSLFAYCAAGAAIWEGRGDDLEFSYRILRAEMDGNIRRLATKAGEKLTETDIKSRIRLDEDYQDAERAAIEARKVAGMLRAIANACRDRKEMLQSIGANRRVEMGATDMHTKTEKVRHTVESGQHSKARRTPRS